ncbi:MAG: RNA polymerase sigma factor [Bacteroidota bacterium]
MQESNLIKKCQQTDAQAQRQLYEQYLPYVLTIARRFGILEQDLADVIQEVFIEIFVHIGRFNAKKGAFKYWLKSIAINKILNTQRKQKRTKQTIIIDSEKIEQESVLADLKNMDNDLIIQLIQGLPDGYRTVFNLYVIDDLSHKEISEQLGIDVATSRSQLSRAKQLLRKQLLSIQKGNRYGLI